MWRTLAALALFLGALALASRVPFPDVRSPTREKAALERVVADYVQANLDNDADALAELYDEDALLLPPDASLVEGRKAIRAFWEDGMETGLSIQPVRVEVHGDVGLVVGRYTVPEATDTPADSGKCVLVMRRQGVNWKITSDIWNTSTPKADDQASPLEENRDSMKTPVGFRIS